MGSKIYMIREKHEAWDQIIYAFWSGRIEYEDLEVALENSLSTYELHLSIDDYDNMLY